jgi:hypothetical protein
MSVAKQVHAKGLQARLTYSDVARQVLEARATLFGAASANDDVVMYAPHAGAGKANSVPLDSTSVRIAGDGLSVVSRMLGLTDHQKEALDRRVISVTASEFGASEGSDALLRFDNESEAAVALHEVGFTRIREASPLVSDRFYKVVESTSGSQAVMLGHPEPCAAGDDVYVHLSRIGTV